jgi:hypothetical protein
MADGTALSIVELDTAARDYLRKAGKNPDIATHVSAKLNPASTNSLFTFYYSQGIGKPVWVVELDRKGKVSGLRITMAREHHDESIQDILTNQPPTPNLNILREERKMQNARTNEFQ